MDSVILNKVCRICLKDSSDLFSIFSAMKLEFEIPLEIKFADMLMSCTSVQVTVGDGLPDLICESCLETLNIAYSFKRLCEKTDNLLQAARQKVSAISSSGNCEVNDESVDNKETSKNKECVNPNIYDKEGEKRKNRKTDLQECLDCNKSFKSENSLLRHRKVHQTTECKMCFLKFKSKKERSKHNQSQHILYGCDQCTRKYKTRYGLYYHKKMHKGIKNYVCPYEGCKKSFLIKQCLKTHISVHVGETKHLCNLCGKGYSTLSALQYHLKTHSGERAHLCVHCGMTFKQACHLKTHMWHHTGIKPHVCKICGKTYTTGHQLKKHWSKNCRTERLPNNLFTFKEEAADIDNIIHNDVANSYIKF